MYLAYWKIRNITFHFRCKSCGNPWLFLDLRTMRHGVCEGCLQRTLFSDNQTEAQKIIFEEVGLTKVKPEFDWLFERMAKKAQSGKSLDVGCQTAYMFTKFRCPRELLYGIDLTSSPLKLAAQNFPGANLCQADASLIPYRDDTFDHLFCTEVLEHIFNAESVLKDCYRVLKPGGSAFLTVPNGRGVAGKYTVAHIRFYTYKSLTKMVETAGFEIVDGKKYGLYIPFISSTSVMFSYILGRRLPFDSLLWQIRMPEGLSYNFYVECRKPVKTTI